MSSLGRHLVVTALAVCAIISLARAQFAMTNVLSGGGYQPRYGHTVVNYLSALTVTNSSALPAGSTSGFPSVSLTPPFFLMWGTYATSTTADVWASTTSGASWFLISGVAPGPPPMYSAVNSTFQTRVGGMGCMDHNGLLYYLAGDRYSAPTNETWYSSNGGTNWHMIPFTTGTGLFTPRQYSSCTVDSQNRLFVINGLIAESPLTVSSDTWYSVNGGQSYTLVTNNGGYTPRQLNGLLTYYSTTYQADILTIIGGCTYSGSTEVALNDVQVSMNSGLSWTSLGTAAFSPRCAMAAAQYQGAMVIAGGRSAGNTQQFGDIWLTLDGGATWLQISSALSARAYPAAVFDSAGTLYITGGLNGTTSLADSQKSSQSFNVSAMQTWIRQISNTYTIPAQPGLQPASTSSSGAATGASGGSDCSTSHAVSSSGSAIVSTGLRFTSVASSSPWYARDDLDVFLYPNTVQAYNASALPAGATSGFPAVTLTAPFFILYGSATTSTTSDVWVSTTSGSSWSLIAGEIPSANQYSAVTSTFQTRIGAVGCMDSLGTLYYIGGDRYNMPSNWTWFSNDTQHWHLQPFSTGSQPFSNRQYTSCATDKQNNVYVANGMISSAATGYATGNDVWMSTNHGATYTQQVKYAMYSVRAGNSLVSYYSAGLSANVLTMIAGCGAVTGSTSALRDVWASSTGGTTWTLLTNSATFPARCSHSSIVSPSNNAIVVAGGSNGILAPSVYYNDAWMSVDGGYTWLPLASTPLWSPRAYFALVLDQSETIYVVGGVTNALQLNDMYRSVYSLAQVRSWYSTLYPLSTVTFPNAFGIQCWNGQCTNTNSNGGSGLSNGAIAGIVIGVVVGVCIIICVVVYLCYSLGGANKKNSASDADVGGVEIGGVENSEVQHDETATETQTA